MYGTVYIMMGLPGSGKSTKAKKLALGNDFIFSTDNYWIRPDGYYDFNASRLGEAHKWNQDQFVNTLIGIDMTHKFIISPSLVVDNTNLDLQSVKPYVDAAISHGYKVELVEPDTEWRYDIGECFKHNTHKVPRDTITKMLNKLNNNRDAIASYIKEANSKIKE